MKKLLFLICFLVFEATSAQEQITNFENIRYTSPQGVQFIDTLGKRIVFFAYQPEKNQPASLWASDGTPANTKILQDAFGESPINDNGVNVRKYGYRYLRGNHIWRTDGLKLERALANSDSISTLQEFDNKLLLVFQKYEKTNNGNGVTFTSFAWLDSLNKVSSVWERNILSYQIIGTELHYIKLNKATKNLELHKVSKGINYSNTILSPSTNLYLQSFEYYTKNQAEYYFLNTNEGKQLILKQKNDTTNVSLFAWGNDGYSQTAVKDTLGNIYFQQKVDNDIRLFGIVENGFPSEKWSYSLKPIYADYTINFNLPALREFSIIGEKLVFVSITGSMGISGYYFNVLDLKSNKNRRSRNLGADFGNRFYTINVSRIDSNTYELDNKIGSIARYSFLADSVIKITKYPYKPSYSTDSLFTVNNQKLLLSRNIYNISTSTKTPLIAEKYVFDLGSGNLSYKILGNKLFFWKYNQQFLKTELWVSNGEKNGSELLVVLEGYFDNYNLNEKMTVLGDKLYFYTNNYQSGLSIYETNGTKSGTLRVFKSDENYSIIYWAKSNEKQVVYRISNSIIIVIEDSKATLIKNIPQTTFGFGVFLTSNKVFLFTNAVKNIEGYPADFSYQEVFKVEKGELILMDKGVDNFFVYKDRLYYTKRNFPENINGTITFKNGSTGIYFLNELDKVNVVIDGLIEQFGVFNDKLVYRQSIVEGKAPRHIIIDLSTNKIDLTFNDFYSYVMESINGALVLSNDVKRLIIKDKQRREFEIGSVMRPLGNGILLGDSKNLSYYDIQKNAVSSIFNDKEYQSPLIGKNAMYMLIPIRIDDKTVSWSYYDVFNKKLTDLNYTGNFFELDSVQSFSSKPIGNDIEQTYWRFDGNNFFRSYVLPQNTNFLKSNTNNYYTTSYAQETGNELIQLGADNIITFPEIVKGDEGITLNTVFQFKNQLYAYVFTFSHGWQVWKMGEGQKAKPLSEEASVENLVNVFPNPVQDMLNVDSPQQFRYRVINSRGQELLKGNVEPQQTISFQDLAQGLYIIQFFDGQKVFSKKVVKY